MNIFRTVKVNEPNKNHFLDQQVFQDMITSSLSSSNGGGSSIADILPYLSRYEPHLTLKVRSLETSAAMVTYCTPPSSSSSIHQRWGQQSECFTSFFHRLHVSFSYCHNNGLSLRKRLVSVSIQHFSDYTVKPKCKWILEGKKKKTFQRLTLYVHTDSGRVKNTRMPLQRRWKCCVTSTGGWMD